MSLRSIDLNLLVVFEALMDERSVTRAARKVGITPSAVSHCLRRLRSTFDDDLLRRTAQGFVPTRRALHLVVPIRDAMRQIRFALAQELDFDPATSKRSFRVQFSNHFLDHILPTLFERMRAEAPGTTLIADYLQPDRSLDLGDSGNLVVRISLGARPEPEYRHEIVFADRLVVVMRRGHPAALKRMTPDVFCSLPQLGPVVPAAGSSMLEHFLARQGLSRRIVAQMSISPMVLPIIRKSDLCALMPARWVENRCVRRRLRDHRSSDRRFSLRGRASLARPQ